MKIELTEWEVEWILGSIDDAPLSCMTPESLACAAALAKKVKQAARDSSWCTRIIKRIDETIRSSREL